MNNALTLLSFFWMIDSICKLGQIMAYGTNLWLIRQQANGTRPLYCLRTITYPQFREDSAHMALDRTECQHERLGNLLVGGTLFQQAEHLQFAFTQRFEGRRRGLILMV